MKQLSQIGQSKHGQMNLLDFNFPTPPLHFWPQEALLSIINYSVYNQQRECVFVCFLFPSLYSSKLIPQIVIKEQRIPHNRALIIIDSLWEFIDNPKNIHFHIRLIGPFNLSTHRSSNGDLEKKKKNQTINLKQNRTIQLQYAIKQQNALIK